MNHFDLFSGIGGFAYAVDQVWPGSTHTFCDNNTFCQKVLAKHWPESTIYGDIRTIAHTSSRRLQGSDSVQTGEKARNGILKETDSQFDLLTGGFPCQPFSAAGKRRGTADDRYLWPEMLRVIRLTKPAWIIGENVGGLVTWNDGMVLEQVCLDLESEGYEVQPFIIPACAVNAPHRRDRVWIVANKQRSRLQVRKKEHGTRISETKRVDRVEETWEQDWLEVAARLCRVDDGIPGELDFIGGIENEQNNSKKTKSEINQLIGKVLRTMWEYRKLATTSPEIYWEHLYHSVPEMPYKRTHEEWLLGSRIENDKELCDLWKTFYSTSQQEAQNLQQELLNKIRKIERKKKVASRVDRLKALGNSIVPQVAMQIMEAIKSV